jgi:hypothetical protein
MAAYYYAFDATGVDAVDVVLSSVACAGKAFHHTDYWGDEDTPERYGDELRGGSPVEWIQNAATDAAEAWRKALLEAEARGRAAERAYVVAQLEHFAATYEADSVQAGILRGTKRSIERGCHVGSATKHADSGSSSDETER